MSRFVMQVDVREDTFDWGSVGWRGVPALTGSSQLVVLDVRLEPGFGHDFHKHPEQEETILVRSGTVEQWIGEERRELGTGDSAFIERGTVHGSFNAGEGPVELLIVMSPAVGEGGYELIDVAGDEPWKRLRR